MDTDDDRSVTGFDKRSCRNHLAGMESCERCALFADLAFERMARKTGNLQKLFEANGQDWEQTAYMMLLQTVGDRSNRENYLEVARQASYERVRREGPSVTVIEALLFGSAGLLEGCRDDTYSSELRQTFEHLRHKYSIRPLDAAGWKPTGNRPANHPRLRLSQIAVLLSRTSYLLDTLINCRTLDDATRIFSAESSTYWSSYYSPSNTKERTTKRLGSQKIQLLSINLVPVLQNFYGNMHGKPELRQRAIDLWEALPPEENNLLDFWKIEGIMPANALESQALLQLSNEHCSRGACGRCRLGMLRRKEACPARK